MADDRAERTKRTRAKFTTKPRVAEAQLPAEEEAILISQQFAYGDVWSREALPIQVRSLVTIGILSALYRTDQMKWHMEMALDRFGVTPEQIVEVSLMSAVYAGLPTGANSQAVAHELFKARGLTEPGKK